MIDTHTHLYSEEFDSDSAEAVQRAKDAGVEHLVLPNVDSQTLPRMLALEAKYPDYCSPAIGLHPTSVKKNFQEELALVKSELDRRKYIAVGEIGLDLYWDKTFLKEQIIAFQKQIEWAIDFNIPIIVHTREAFEETIQAVEPYRNTTLTGVFHSFTGNATQAEKLLSFDGFYLGINGIVTYKNSDLINSLPSIGIERLVIETDAPYLSPVPYRGKRNESAYVIQVSKKLAEIFTIDFQKVNEITTKNAKKLFKII